MKQISFIPLLILISALASAQVLEKQSSLSPSDIGMTKYTLNAKVDMEDGVFVFECRIYEDGKHVKTKYQIISSNSDQSIEVSLRDKLHLLMDDGYGSGFYVLKYGGVSQHLKRSFLTKTTEGTSSLNLEFSCIETKMEGRVSELGSKTLVKRKYVFLLAVKSLDDVNSSIGLPEYFKKGSHWIYITDKTNNIEQGAAPNP